MPYFCKQRKQSLAKVFELPDHLQNVHMYIHTVGIHSEMHMYHMVGANLYSINGARW